MSIQMLMVLFCFEVECLNQLRYYCWIPRSEVDDSDVGVLAPDTGYQLDKSIKSVLFWISFQLFTIWFRHFCTVVLKGSAHSVQSSTSHLYTYILTTDSQSVTPVVTWFLVSVFSNRFRRGLFSRWILGMLAEFLILRKFQVIRVH